MVGGCAVLPTETIGGDAVILFSGFHNGLLPLHLVQCIGIELGFQADTASGGVVLPTFTNTIGVVGGVKLNTGAIGINRHASSAAGVGEKRTRIAEHLKIVVITLL